MGQCPVGIEQAFDEDLDPATCLLGPEKPRLHDTRIVEDQQVTRFQQIGQIAEMAVVQRTGCTIDMQQPGVTSLLGRVLGNQFPGKIEMKIGRLHGGGI